LQEVFASQENKQYEDAPKSSRNESVKKHTYLWHWSLVSCKVVTRQAYTAGPSISATAEEPVPSTSRYRSGRFGEPVPLKRWKKLLVVILVNYWAWTNTLLTKTVVIVKKKKYNKIFFA
jgi:hypothetical protein